MLGPKRVSLLEFVVAVAAGPTAGAGAGVPMSMTTAFWEAMDMRVATREIEVSTRAR